MSNEEAEQPPLLVRSENNRTITMTKTGSRITVHDIGDVQIFPHGPDHKIYRRVDENNNLTYYGYSQVTRTFSLTTVETFDQDGLRVVTSESTHGHWWSFVEILCKLCNASMPFEREFKFIATPATGQTEMPETLSMNAKNIVLDPNDTTGATTHDDFEFEGTNVNGCVRYELNFILKAGLPPLQGIGLFHSICLSVDQRKQDEQKIPQLRILLVCMIMSIILVSRHQLLAALIVQFSACCGVYYFYWSPSIDRQTVSVSSDYVWHRA